MSLNVYAIAYPVHTLGPGCRVALWTAGCTKRCPGCMSPELRSPQSGKPVGIATLVRRMAALDLLLPLTGITISGGEPVDQAEALGEMLEALHRSKPEWDIILYSGYTLREIERMEPGARRLLSLVDILIDGPYVSGSPSSHPLAGSGNQGIHPLSPRGVLMGEALGSLQGDGPDLGIGPEGLTFAIGVNAVTDIRKASAAIAERSLQARGPKGCSAR